MAAKVHRADESAPPPSGVPSLSVRVNGLPLLQSRPQREPITPKQPLHQWPQRRRRWHCRRCFLPQAPLRPLLAPWETLCSQWCCRGDLQFPAVFLNWHFLWHPSGESTWRALAKCTSNQDSVVCHCLQEHFGVNLVYPQCGMSYSDLSKFCLHGRGTHNLLFTRVL